MNQDQTIDTDLQKAIEDIANTTNKTIEDITNTANVDPVFSDPVAAPSSVPEGDAGELGEPVGPFPEPQADILPPAPEPITTTGPTPPPTLPTPPEPATTPDFNMPELATPPLPPEPVFTPTEPTPMSTPEIPVSTSNLNMHQVKEAALRELVPILGKLTLSPEQKFNIYRDIFENLRDYTVLESAFNAAREIPNDEERAKALLYLIESIDKM